MKFLAMVLYSLLASTCHVAAKCTVKDSLAVIITLGVDCPISAKYTAAINSLYSVYGNKITLKAIVPSPEYTESQLQAFKKKYIIHFPMELDTLHTQIMKWNFKVMPEAVLLVNNTIVYQGAISDMFVRLGQKRAFVQHAFLEECINAVLNKKPLPYKHQKAIGCTINEL